MRLQTRHINELLNLPVVKDSGQKQVLIEKNTHSGKPTQCIVLNRTPGKWQDLYLHCSMRHQLWKITKTFSRVSNITSPSVDVRSWIQSLPYYKLLIITSATRTWHNHYHMQVLHMRTLMLTN